MRTINPAVQTTIRTQWDERASESDFLMAHQHIL